ncbi:MAG: transposase [Clostridia bacterium]|nr:transposase [Clostridia bacterium]
MLGNVSVNQVLHDRILGNDIRILYIAPDESYLYWIELAKDGGMPRKESLSDLETRMLAEELVKADDTWLPPTDDSNEKNRKHREECWELLGSALMNEPEIYEKSARAGILQPIADESGRLVSNLYPMLKRYWRYGKVKNAFLPADERKGGKGQTRRLRKNSGPTPGENATCSKILTETDIGLFEKYYNKYYLKGNGNSLQDVYDRMIREEYSDKTDNGSGIEQITSHGHGGAPTFRQFQYWHMKNRDRNLETVEREGESAMNLKERATTGKADFGMRGPGAQYQIDATVADVYLVSRFNRANIIGRPIVYFVKDTFSRIVTGLYVGLEGPSWMGMAMALYNAFTDKVDFCHKYGIEITEDQWPCHHLPFAMIGDRGELESEHGERLANRLGIQIDNTPPYRGDLKPIIERHFRILNDSVVHRLPGNVKPDMSQRCGKDYRRDATLDLEQFTRIMIVNTLTYNKVTMQSFEPSAEMMKAGVELTPLALWNWGIHNSSGALRVADEETCRLALMPEDTCDITREGIKFHKLFYSCDRAVREQWFENARRDGSYKLKVSYDPRDVHAIYVWSDGEHKPDRAVLLNWEQKFDGKSSEECDYEMEVIDALKGKRAKQDKDAILTADNYVDSVLAEAKAMKADISGKSKTEMLSGIKFNRKQEKETQRAKESFVREDEDPETDETSETGTAVSSQDTRGKREMTDLEKLIWGIEDE